MTDRPFVSRLTDPRLQTYWKILILIGLALLSLLPLASIRELVLERQQNSRTVAEEMADIWGGAQRLIGPLLVLPIAPDGRIEELAPLYGMAPSSQHRRSGDRPSTLIVTADALKVESRVAPELRRRGIYEQILFAAETLVAGHFAEPDLSALGLRQDDLLWDKARLVFLVGDSLGLRDARDLQWNAAPLDLSPVDGEAGAVFAPLAGLREEAKAWPAEFSATIELQGSGTFGLLPLADHVSVEVDSSWPHPSFFGSRLPKTHAITAEGFTAHWHLSRFDRPVPKAWLSDGFESMTLLERARDEALTMALIDPVDHYRQSERSVKYGLLFVVLVSAVLFCFEALSPVRVHPIQYGMAAAALCLFFLLLLSLSEVIGFAAGYALAAGLTTALLAGYVAAVFRSRARGAWLALLLGIVYGYLFLTLRSDHYALLLGTALLFGALAVIMFATRRLDWYELGGRLSGTPAAGRLDEDP